MTGRSRRNIVAVPLAIIGADTASGPLLDAILSSDRGVLDPIGFWSPPTSDAPRTRVLLRAIENFDTLDMLLNAADCVYVASRKVDWLAVARIALGKGKAVVCERPSYLDFPETAKFVREAQNAWLAFNYVTPSTPAFRRLQLLISWGAVSVPRKLVIHDCGCSALHDGHSRCSDRKDDCRWVAQGSDLLVNALFLTRRLIGPLRMENARTMDPRTKLISFKAASVPSFIIGETLPPESPHKGIWTVEGVGAVRLCGWSEIQRQAPDGTWWPDTLAPTAEAFSRAVLSNQLQEIEAFALRRPHHLAALFEAWELEAFLYQLGARAFWI
jgi:GFO/IDH/MocA oxidoreductase family protein